MIDSDADMTLLILRFAACHNLALPVASLLSGVGAANINMKFTQ